MTHSCARTWRVRTYLQLPADSMHAWDTRHVATVPARVVASHERVATGLLSSGAPFHTVSHLLSMRL